MCSYFDRELKSFDDDKNDKEFALKYVVDL